MRCCLLTHPAPLPASPVALPTGSGVDLDNNMLIYECSGLDTSSDPSLQAVATAAALEEAALLANQVPVLDGTLPAPPTATQPEAMAAAEGQPDPLAMTTQRDAVPAAPIAGVAVAPEAQEPGRRHLHRHLLGTTANAEIASGWMVSTWAASPAPSAPRHAVSRGAA